MWDLLQWEAHNIPTSPNITFDTLNQACLIKELDSFHLTGN